MLEKMRYHHVGNLIRTPQLWILFKHTVVQEKEKEITRQLGEFSPKLHWTMTKND